nr:leucine-rich repeat-containing protein 51-like [Onthophagus taurus]
MGNVPKNELQELETARPADFSFKKLKTLSEYDCEQARETRIGGIPERGQNHRFLTRAVWLNNNRLIHIQNLDVFMNSVLEYPNRLGWLDVSYNRIGGIDLIIQKFVNLIIIYFHGNNIDNIDEVKKLATLGRLRSVTFHGNPIVDKPFYRSYVINCLPQICNLDFTPITKADRYQTLAPPPERENED